MSPSASLRDVSQHFAFGENWSRYAELIDETRIESARVGLERLIGGRSLDGLSFLDIGCGSGVHALAALQFGSARVLATDIDPDSVATTRGTLDRFAPHMPWEAKQVSVFDLSPNDAGTFDVVYSWGVLHHTGDMYEAIRRAAAMVAPEGRLVVALYRRTPLCGVWKIEKRVYSRAHPIVQRAIMSVFRLAARGSFAVRGESFDEYVATYHRTRGMNFDHDAHDWLGGYPYESITPAEAHAFLSPLGFEIEREFTSRPGLGLTGSGCDEYTFRRR